MTLNCYINFNKTDNIFLYLLNNKTKLLDFLRVVGQYIMVKIFISSCTNFC